MAGIQVLTTPARMLFSGNEAVARAVWESGVRVASAYPGTPATEMLENLTQYPDLYAEWSVNEKVALEVAIGASIAGSRSFCAMKHVGLNVASDALMTLTLTGAAGGMLIAVADDVGLSSSQNEQDSRFWGRFAHLPLLEPADSQEAYDMVIAGYDLSEQFQVPVILRLTTRICHVKAMVTVGERVPHDSTGYIKNPQRWVMTPGFARSRIALMFERDEKLRASAEVSPLNFVVAGKDRRVGFVSSGPAWMHVQEAFPHAPALKLGFSYPAPIEKIRAFSQTVEQLLVVEELEPLLENELRAAGIACHGKDVLPRSGELPPEVLRPAFTRLLGELVQEDEVQGALPAAQVFPRPPTLCTACPHLGIYYTVAKLKNVTVAGDIGCYTLGSGHPWNALDAVICMGASMGRGATPYNRAAGDASNQPNPSLAAPVMPSFYAIKLQPGDIGTLEGLSADAHGRVLDGAGEAIPGLYAAGNDSVSPMGGEYPAAGITIGAALTFGFLAARHAAGVTF